MGAAVLEKGKLIHHGVEVISKGQSPNENLRNARKTVLRLVKDFRPQALALEKTFSGVKLNHGLFGNTTPHLHWHIMVRRGTDPDPKSTIWESEFPVVEQSDEDFLKTAEEIRRNL